MKETLRHKEAFDYYYSLGVNRSLQKVARKFTVSETSARKWSAAFDWQNRILERDRKNAEAISKAVDRQIVSHDAKYIKIANAAIDVFAASLVGRIRHICEKCGETITIPVPKAEINASDFAKLVATVKVVLGGSDNGEAHIVEFVDVEPKKGKYVESREVTNG